MTPAASSPTAARRTASSGATAVLLVLAVLAGAPGFMAAILSSSRAFTWLEPAGATRHDPAAVQPGQTVETVRAARVNPRPARARLDSHAAPAPITWALTALDPIAPNHDAPTLAPASGVRLALLCLPPPSLA